MLTTRVMALFFQGRAAEIGELFEQLADAAGRADDDWSLGLADLVEGEIAHYSGDVDRAEARLRP